MVRFGFIEGKNEEKTGGEKWNAEAGAQNLV
jgi:hypothetical protein